MTAGLNPVPNVRETQLEDPLAYLPCSSILERRKGQVIYNEDQASTGIYLVLQGKVKVSHHLDGGRQVVIDIYHEDDFFGESGFLNLNRRGEEALALETSRLMAWTTAEIEDDSMRRPRLGVALLQLLAQRSIEFAKRIDSFSSDKIEQRLARALVRFRPGIGGLPPRAAIPCTYTYWIGRTVYWPSRRPARENGPRKVGLVEARCPSRSSATASRSYYPPTATVPTES